MIDHVCLLVSDLTKAKKYYEEIFSVESRFHPNDEKTCMFENEKIHFFITEVDYPKEFLRKQHLSVEVDDIKESEIFLKSKGIAEFNKGIFTHFNYRNYKWIEWRDPDGVRLEFVEIID